MGRSNPTFYVRPSDISIEANVHAEENDLAVYIARNTKIKVFSRGIAALNTVDGVYQEWALTGRNRRLANSSVPYTIFARVNKTDKTDGYLIFAPQTYRDGVWVDKYSSVTMSGLSVLYTENGHDVVVDSPTYWYLRLGDVSLPVSGERTVTLDTGILGTDQYNEEWELNPDDLPLRVDISNNKTASVPYVAWGDNIVVTGHLVRGFDTDAASSARLWTIRRDTGDTAADNTWNAVDRSATFGVTGSITLAHSKTGTDDFNAAVAASFVITAWGYADDDSSSSSSSEELVVLATGMITILAETLERYEVALSTHVASYSPITEQYAPTAGITVRIRATGQDGTVFYLSSAQVNTAQLTVIYAPTGTPVSGGTELELTGDPASGVIPISAFHGQQSIDVHLVNGANVELSEDTVAFVRDGEDSRQREWIYFRNTTTSYGVLPSQIMYGEVSPSGEAGTGTAYDSTLDKWVPAGWWDHPQGVTTGAPYEYASFRDYISDADSSSSDDGGHWGPFSTPTLWSHYGERGVDGDGVEYVFIRTNKPTPPVLDTTQTGYAAEEFCPQASVTDGYIKGQEAGDTLTTATCTDDPAGPNATWQYEWVTQRCSTLAADGKTRTWPKFTEIALWSKWSEDGVSYIIDTSLELVTIPSDVNSVELELSGSFWKKVGEDDKAAAAMMTIGCILSSGGTRTRFMTVTSSPVSTFSNMEIEVEAGDIIEIYIWKDTASVDPTYQSYVQKKAIPVIRDGERGVDGEGVEYVFIRTNKETAPVLDTTQTGYASPEFCPQASVTDGYIKGQEAGDTLTTATCTDDPAGPNATWQYEWVAQRCSTLAADGKTRTWPKFTEIALWSKWSEDGVSYIIDTSLELVTIPSDVNSVELELSGSFWKKVGEDDKAAAAMMTIGCILSSGGTRTRFMTVTSSPVSTFSNMEIEVEAGDIIEIYIWKDTASVDPTYQSYVQKKAIPVLKDGNTGQLGPMLYPAGQYTINTYYRQDGDVWPYVIKDETYYYLNTPLSSAVWVASEWTEMTQFDAIFAKFAVIDYGKMGSAIFCGDWMFSQYGTLYVNSDGTVVSYIVDNISHSTDSGHYRYDEVSSAADGGVPYTCFSPYYPDGVSDDMGDYPLFAPSWAVDFLTGAQIGAGGNFKLKASGDVEIMGTVKAKVLAHSFASIYVYYSSGTVTDLMTAIANCTVQFASLWNKGEGLPTKLVFHGNTVNVHFRMPPAADYIGHEIELFNGSAAAFYIEGGSSSSGNLTFVTGGSSVTAYIGANGSLRLLAVKNAASSDYLWLVLGFYNVTF